MCVPLDVPPADLTYIHLETVSQHFGVEKKTHKICYCCLVTYVV